LILAMNGHFNVRFSEKRKQIISTLSVLLVQFLNSILIMMNHKEDKRIYTLSQETPAKAVIKMSVPLIFGMFIMVLYNLVDTYFIGLTGDDYQMAAVNLAYPVMMVTVAISNMIGTGASSFIARCLGAEEKEKAIHSIAFSAEPAFWILWYALGAASYRVSVK